MELLALPPEVRRAIPARSAAPTAEQPEERPVLSVAEVLAPADGVPARYGAMILVTTFASLRFGELTALQRTDLDLSSGLVRVRRALVGVRGRGLVLGPPKS